MNGKGSKRRPCKISQQEWDRRYTAAFRDMEDEDHGYHLSDLHPDSIRTRNLDADGQK